MNLKDFRIGDKVYIIDRIDVFGREFLVIEPAIIERCYIGDSDFRGDYCFGWKHNGQSVGDYQNNLLHRQ